MRNPQDMPALVPHGLSQILYRILPSLRLDAVLAVVLDTPQPPFAYHATIVALFML